MLIHRLFQSRWFLVLFALIPLIFSIINYYKNSNSINNLFSFNKNKNILIKIFEINDREPTFKLVTYQGYKFPLERNRAQTLLTNQLKLHQTCQKHPNTTIVDIGASLGEFGLYAAACGCQVFMFEIEPRKFSFIEKSIKINKFESNVHLIKKAVTDLRENKKIYFSKNTSSQLSSIDNYNENDIYFGETINLNNYSFPSSIYLLRIDVQGYELHVLRASENLFRQHLVHHLIFEYTNWGTTRNVHKDIFGYTKIILHAKAFYALHPNKPIIYGPLNDEDLNQFDSQHRKKHLQRDIYASFKDQQTITNAIPYNFHSSF